MLRWISELFGELHRLWTSFLHACWGMRPRGHYQHRGILLLALSPTALMLVAGYFIAGRSPAIYIEIPELPKPAAVLALPAPPMRPLTMAVRPMPNRFPARTRMPSDREGHASLSISKVSFDASRDLVRLEDDRVWWESEHDHGDTEDDHVMHRALEEPMRRLIELVSQEGATLKVQDCYRAHGIHSATSLHKQGRAADLTCDDLGLEHLARLTWAAGFDWVYYEAPKRGGHHVHASVRP